jgi:hypothetical protein
MAIECLYLNLDSIVNCFVDAAVAVDVDVVKKVD